MAFHIFTASRLSWTKISTVSILLEALHLDIPVFHLTRQLHKDMYTVSMMLKTIADTFGGKAQISYKTHPEALLPKVVFIRR